MSHKQNKKKRSASSKASSSTSSPFLRLNDDVLFNVLSQLVPRTSRVFRRVIINGAAAAVEEITRPSTAVLLDIASFATLCIQTHRVARSPMGAILWCQAAGLAPPIGFPPPNSNDKAASFPLGDFSSHLSGNTHQEENISRAKEQEIFGSGYDITTEAHRQMWVSMRKSLGRECVEAISVLSRVHRTVGSVQTTRSRKGEGCMVDGVCDESCGGGDHCNWIVATTDDTHLSMGCVSIQPHDLSQPRLVFCAARHASYAYCTTETFKLAQAVLKSQGCTFVRMCGGQTPESEDHETMHWNAKQIRSASKALLGNTPILSETQLVAVIAAAVCPAWGTCMDDYNSPQTAFDSFDLQSYFAQTERQVYKTLGADVNALATSTETNRMHKNHRGLLTFLCGPILNYATREIEDGPFYETAQIMTWQIETCLDKIHLNPQQFLEKSTRDGQAHAQYALEKLKRDERLLLRAVTNQDWDVMRNLLQQDNPPNFTATIENGTYPNNNNVGMTALHFAFRDHAPLDIIREIYKAYPAALHCGERSGLTPGELLGPTNPNNPNYTAEEYEAVTNYKNRIMDGQSSDESDENSSDESGSDEDSGGDCDDDDDDNAACHFCQGAHTSSDCPSLEDES